MVKTLPKGSAALVTGGARRIGQAVCFKLAELGFNIALHYHSSETQATKTAQQIKKKFNVRCELFPCDLGNETQVCALLETVVRKFPQLNLLVNSASIFEPSSFSIQQLELFNQHFAINLKAPFILSSEFKRLCRQGQIINFIDTDIVKNKTTHTAYLLTKKSLAEMTKLAAVDFAPEIRVNAIAPGLILPPKAQAVSYLDRRAKDIPLKRKGNVQYITQSIQFLLENDFMTGQFLFNDGGEQLV